MDIKAQLSKKIGPLPLGAWIVIVGGAGAYVVYMRRNAQPVDDTPFEDTGTPAGVGEGPGGLIQAMPYQTNSGSGYSGQQIETNDDWARVAINYLVAKGIAPAVATTAISRYINSESLSTSQWAVVSMAIAYAGSPPLLPSNDGNPDPLNPNPKDDPKATFTPGWYHVTKNGTAGRASEQETSASKKTVNSGTNLFIVQQKLKRSQATDGLWYFSANLAPGRYTAAPNKKASVTYTVPSAQTLATIARRFKISSTTVFNANKAVLKKVKVTSPGDKTKIPKGTKLVIPAA